MPPLMVFATLKTPVGWLNFNVEPVRIVTAPVPSVPAVVPLPTDRVHAIRPLFVLTLPIVVVPVYVFVAVRTKASPAVLVSLPPLEFIDPASSKLPPPLMAPVTVIVPVTVSFPGLANVVVVPVVSVMLPP